ncbi:MAG: hypothetical protein G01um101448_1209 [Parcubacteria group bacterium Gr01-1014_48]|nr:MAG: hypothetical protein Greene041614_737 [Parcubacteria group bacterium Greene0416_14]TSC71364.1 MAG: hypothetical protein G01um101448_1209 [Parcubacteria group bacterium Gr01-1014_48]TSD00709.1 MAG: hypothetical protein Greene101415_709 [Parcubacteria group bacterium Greene1014_15]TSD06780.1 MAG: hypothetical protein Greene07144_1109 [Parcubacteria group bacterium Greene0714_4]
MDKKHLKCLLWKGLWLWGALSLVGAWIAGEGGQFMGFGAQHLFSDALVLAALSIPIKLDCHSCFVCQA